MRRQTILLIEPPFYRLYDINASLNNLPLSLAYLAGVIRERSPNWMVRIYNSDFSPHNLSLTYEYMVGQGFDNYLKALKEPASPIWEVIKNTIRQVAPSVIGITVKSQNYTSACTISRIAKSIDSNVTVILGGPHVTLIKGEILDEPMIDIGVLGEGEETIVEILDTLEGNTPLSTVKGIVYREGNRVVESQAREFIHDLDSLPFPVTVAKDCLIDFEKYPRQAFKNIFALRGCPFSCSFCGSRYTWGRKVRFRSVESIVSELQEIQKLGISYVHFSDDTWGIKKSFIQDLCSAMKEKCPRLSWSCEMHVRHVDEETIALMKSAGCRLIQIGVESGNNEMLKLIRKNITIEDAFSAARIIKRHNIHLECFFMVGFPHETTESLGDTISAISSIPTDEVLYSIFTPYLGTELFDYCNSQGIIPSDFDVALYNHQSPENYFCPQIPRDVFTETVRELERKLDSSNSRKRLMRYLSREGYLKLRERGFRRTAQKLVGTLWKVFQK